MSRESARIQKLFKELIRVRPQSFPLARKRLGITSNHGVYIIYGPQKHILHVGRTVRGKNGLRQRLKNHLHGASSFSIAYLRGKESKLRGTHGFAYVEVPDARTRALLESYAVGHLCPKHLGIGEDAHKKAKE
jgi:hypothetical protein